MLLYNPTISGSLLVTGSLTTTGTITSQTLVVQTITSSIEFVTGSTRNGSLASNTHEFTGSVSITGSLAINGTTAVVGSGTANYVPKFIATGTIGNSNLINDANGNLGLGTATPTGYSSRILNIFGSASAELHLTTTGSGTLQSDGLSLSLIHI